MTDDPSMDLTDDDPEYRIAYDVECGKVGCVLIQAALGGTVPRDLYYRHFGAGGEAWTVKASGCRIYPIRKSQLPLLAERTSFERG